MSEMDQDFWNEAYKDDPHQVVIADHFLEKEVSNLPAGTAVDLGCGTGQNALMLARRGWQVTGVDWAEEAIILAQQAALAQGLDARFLVADTTTWPPPQQFDLVISTYALPGGKDSQKVLETAVKALAPGGTLIILEWDKSMAEVWHFDEGDLMSPEEIAALLPGLEVEKAEVRPVKNPFGDDRKHDGGDEDTAANVALVRAKKPASSK